MTLSISEVARQQVQLKGLPQQLGDVPNIESAHQVEPMDFDRPDADIQRCGDLTIGLAQRDQSEDLPLTGRDMERRFGTVFSSWERKGRAFSCHLFSSQNCRSQSSKRPETCKRNYGYMPSWQLRRRIRIKSFSVGNLCHAPCLPF
jgi:hypothetical protein